MGQRLARTELFAEWRNGNMVVASMTETTGRYIFCHSGTGTDGVGNGFAPDDPVATIDYGIGLATASVGDVLIVMPGHAESIAAAAGIVCDKIGLTIQGIGVGSNRPTVTVITDTDADIDIDAASTTIKGIRFVSGVDSLKNILDVNAAYFWCEDCEFVSSNTFECINYVDLATTVDNFTFKKCVFRQPTDPDGTDNGVNTGCFYIVDSENILIEDCEFYGEFESAIFNNRAAGTACKNLWIRNCFGEQALAGADILTLVTGATGGMQNCAWNLPDAADNTTWGTFVTAGQGTYFGMHDVTFMGDNAAGELLASAVATAST